MMGYPYHRVLTEATALFFDGFFSFPVKQSLRSSASGVGED